MLYEHFVTFISYTDNQAYALCPLHQEKTPSFTVNKDTEEWYCHGCAKGGGPKEFIMELYDVDHTAATYAAHCYETKGMDGWPFPSEVYIQKCQDRLWSKPSEIAVLNSFGISDETLKQFRIGWEDTRYTIPIMSRTGRYINMRKYLPPHRRIEGSNNAKLLNLKGLSKGSPRLYPYSALESPEPIIIVEGEKDCLAAISQGLNAVTGEGMP